MTTHTKICGIKDLPALQAAVEAGAEYVGFVFFEKSPRNIAPAAAVTLAKTLPETVKSVAVTVDMSDEQLDALFSAFKPDLLQCHGKETPDRLREIKRRYGVPIIKAISVRSSDDIASAGAFTHVADYLLFDAKAPASMLPGGNGLAFDWKLLKDREFLLPWFLSGGITMDNVTEALHITRAPAVDVSSSLESAPGQKDPRLIGEFVTKVKAL